MKLFWFVILTFSLSGSFAEETRPEVRFDDIVFRTAEWNEYESPLFFKNTFSDEIGRGNALVLYFFNAVIC
jgi:hypothetical protein